MKHLSRITVVGGGIAAWMSAAYLARALKRLGTEIVQVPAGELFVPPVIATLPSLDMFHAALAFDLRDLMRACGGSFRLGTHYKDPGGIHAYGDTGQAFGSVPFHLAWRAHAQDLSPQGYNNHSFAALLAKSGKFAPPGSSNAPGFSVSPALHLEGNAYLDFQRRAALHYGVQTGRPLTDNGLDPETGMVRLQDGTTLESDLVIDAREDAPNEDWVASSALPAHLNVNWTRRTDPAALLGLSSIRRMKGGVAVEVPMTSAVWSAHVGTNAKAGAGRDLTPGWHEAPWQGRCVRIGDAACQLPPGEAPELRIVQAGIEALLGFLPGGAPGLPERAEYNRVMKDTFRALADFSSLMFLDPACSLEGLPDSLALRLRNFTSRGRIVLLDGESLNRASWASVLIAAGWTMQRADAHAAALPVERVREAIRAMAGTLAATSEAAPDQRAFLTRAGILRRASTGAA